MALFNARDRVRLDEGNARQPTIVLSGTPGEEAAIDTDLSGGTKLFLSAKVAADAEVYWPVTWQAPRFVFADGTERPLSDYAWASADAIWDSASMKPAEGGAPAELRAQAFAVIEYAIPAGAVRFKATVRTARPEHDESNIVVRVLTVVGTEHNEDRRPGISVEVGLADLGIVGEVAVRDLWARKDIGSCKGTLAAAVPFHGARLLRISPRSSPR